MLMITNRAIAPDTKRIVVKLDASIAPSANARRHKTEFAAKAANARHVRVTVLRAVLIIDCRRWISEVDHLLLEISSMIKFPQPSSNMFSKPQKHVFFSTLWATQALLVGSDEAPPKVYDDHSPTE